MSTFGGLLSGNMTDYTPEEEAELPRRYAREARQVKKVLEKDDFFGMKPVYVRVRDLADVKAAPWHAGRLREAKKAFQADPDFPTTLLPITITMDDYGRRVISDGNHRLAAARELGIEFILAVFGCPRSEE